MLARTYRKLFSGADDQNPNKPLLNFDKYIDGEIKGRALLSYLPSPVRDELAGHVEIMFSNRGIARSIPRAINELGYIADIIYWEDRDFQPLEKYDFVIFHGGRNFDALYPRLLGSPKIVYFGSGSYWEFSNKAEDRRIKNFERRHKTKAARDRYVYDSETKVSQASDGIIVLGDESMRETFPKEFRPVLTINNASYPDSHFDSEKKDYSQAKHNFLFFSGDGNIHKGLDLILDAFSRLPYNLYVVTTLNSELAKTYKKILEQPNIHLIGPVIMRSLAFYDAVDKCSFVILPSCSEGQAGSVVEAMNQGLIPIVSRETRLDVKDFGKILEKSSITEIKETVSEMVSLSDDTVEKKAKLSRLEAVREHSPDYFVTCFKAHLNRILEVAK
jgi:glycosyltransferase involved in cell wall biosynthesis